MTFAKRRLSQLRLPKRRLFLSTHKKAMDIKLADNQESLKVCTWFANRIHFGGHGHPKWCFQMFLVSLFQFSFLSFPISTGFLSYLYLHLLTQALKLTVCPDLFLFFRLNWQKVAQFEEKETQKCQNAYNNSFWNIN